MVVQNRQDERHKENDHQPREGEVFNQPKRFYFFFRWDVKHTGIIENRASGFKKRKFFIKFPDSRSIERLSVLQQTTLQAARGAEHSSLRRPARSPAPIFQKIDAPSTKKRRNQAGGFLPAA
jgi:hypothetical protein